MGTTQYWKQLYTLQKSMQPELIQHDCAVQDNEFKLLGTW